MNVGRKISLACAFLVMLTAIVASIALYRVSDIHSKLVSVTDHSLPGVYSIGKLAQINRVITGNILLHIGVPAQRPAMEAKILAGQKQFAALLEAYGKSIDTSEEKQLYEALAPATARLAASWDKLRPVSTAGDTATAWKIWLEDGRPAMLDLEQKLNAEIDFSRAAGGRNADATTESVAGAQSWILVFLALSVLSGGGLAFHIVRGLNRQLRRTAIELTRGASDVAGAAAQVAAASHSLADGASQEAASLEETAASAEEITAMTYQNAENSRLASEAMGVMDGQVSEGNRTLKDMLTSMKEIKTSSGKISQIIKTIDEIAFQTNILALNAAVEAARAGGAGAGFAVVADEVRNLAQRSADAARETATLIEESVVKSTEGSSKAERVAAIIQTITDNSVRVKTLVDDVCQGSGAQSQRIEEIAHTIARLEGLTQSAAASAQQSAAASKQLSAHSSELREVASALGEMVGTG
jgi:methyl-accepting chemotaxis protein/methyl-accepting chemotaxis protein-1 (serine sensor receptor)